VSVRPLLPSLVALAAGCSTPDSDDPVERGLAFLFSRQEADGAWRSRAYAELASGRALTPFVLEALAAFPDDRLAARRRDIDRALDAILRDAGAPTEYPNYSRALAVLALARFRPPGWEDAAKRFAAELLSRQIRRSAGDPIDGSWDLGAPVVTRPDLSVTAFALEALAAVRALDPPTRDAALRFVARCRASDGGYFFTSDPVQAPFQNKAGRDEETGSYRAYATATADAVRCLRAAGVPDDDPRIAGALAWLRLNPSLDYAAGVPLDIPERTAEGLRFYSWNVRRRVEGAVPGLRAKVVSLQLADGSWRNEVGIMKEDDPIVATGLALPALR
jgi:hypothetical protein